MLDTRFYLAIITSIVLIGTSSLFELIDIGSKQGLIYAVVMVLISFFTVFMAMSDSSKPTGERFPVTLVSVYDADTIKLSFHGRVESYRIQFIDAPELDQKFGEESAAMLTILLRNKYLEYSLPESGNDKTYNRTLCTLYANGNNVGLELVRRGYAWIDIRYETPDEYILAFHHALSNKKGMFAKGYPVHPELYRKRKKKSIDIKSVIK